MLVFAILLARIPPVPVTGAASFERLDGTLLAAASVKLETRPPTPWLMAGEAVTYAIHATPQGVGTAAAEITLNYGRDLELVEVQPGPYLGENTIPGPQISDADKRQATYVWARVGPTPNPSEPGVLAYVTFRAASGRPWNTWVRQQVSLVDGQLQVAQQNDSAFQLHVYHRLPVPMGVLPDALLSPDGARTGPHAAFGLRTQSPGSFRYRIVVSQDNFESTSYTFDQTISQPGWDNLIYRGGTLARFVSPEALKPGKYQWRAYALIEEVNQWTGASQVREFEVGGETMGLDLVSPMTIARFEEGQARVAVEGWGFTSATGATLAIPGTGTAPLEIEWASDARVVVIVPESIGPGLAELSLRREDGQVRTSPLLVLPPALFNTRVDLPRARQIIPGQEFTVQLAFSNSGTGDDRIALVAVDLPNSRLFQLVSIEGQHPDGQEMEGQDSVEVLDQDLNLVLLAAGDGAGARFNFRLLPRTAGLPGTAVDQTLSVGASLEFLLKPVVLGEVSPVRWEQLQSEPVERRVQAVQDETAQRLRIIAQSFNRAPPALLEGQLAMLLAGSESSAALELITRLPGNGLDLSRIFSAFASVSSDDRSKLIREYRYFAGVWP